MRRSTSNRSEGVAFALCLAVLIGSWATATEAGDGVTLFLGKGPDPGDLTLEWTGGQPLFEIYAGTAASSVIVPSNSLGTTSDRVFVTPEGSDDLVFFLVTTPCVIDGPEVCDGIDNDCNGTVDDPGAESSCALANATAACDDGTCVIDFCDVGWVDCDEVSATGCEFDFSDFSNDPANCSGCGIVCPDPANAEPQCVASECGYFCDPGFWDCDAAGGNGCELSDGDLQSDSQNCGSCGEVCTVPNGLGVCVDGGCEEEIAACDPNYYDLNDDPVDGCEYFCVFMHPNDSPDDGFIDANCDGIDGNAATAIFASPAGNNANPGTIDLPVQTVTEALSRAQSLSRTEVYLDQGTYLGQVNLINGISIHGGYSRVAGWARSASFVSEIRSTTAVGGAVTAVACTGVVSPTKLDRLRITTANAIGVGVTNYGVRTSGCSGLTLHACTIIAGNGSAGAPGAPGATGANGGNGGNGQPGSCDGAHGLGGTAGTSTCGRGGGAGGRGGLEGNNPGLTGAAGVGPTAGGPGGNGGDPGQTGGNGTNGAAGGPGSHGGGGSGGSVSGAAWVTNAGANGTSGTPGNGGGGGGGGGGQGCTFCDNGGGNGGGGGGAGGCAGTLGTGGSGGGGSFGVFLVSSTGATISSSTIQGGNGGGGGNGQSGGPGGGGGSAGPGAGVCTSEVGRGGNGGTGGAGGAGGSGGGGAGGPSWAVYRHLSIVTLLGNTLFAGTGGSGGAAPMNPGSPGASGTLF